LIEEASAATQIDLVNHTVQNVVGNGTNVNLVVEPSDVQMQDGITVVGGVSVFQVAKKWRIQRDNDIDRSFSILGQWSHLF